MLSEEEKSTLKYFLITELKWNELSFCISDKRNSIRKLETRIFTDSEITLDHLNKLKEFLKCNSIFIKTFLDSNHNLMIGWI
jgi:hypothetical protein